MQETCKSAKAIKDASKGCFVQGKLRHDDDCSELRPKNISRDTSISAWPQRQRLKQDPASSAGAKAKPKAAPASSSGTLFMFSKTFCMKKIDYTFVFISTLDFLFEMRYVEG